MELDEELVVNFYKGVYDALSVDSEESSELLEFFQVTHPPAVSALTQTRALAFKVACDYLTDNKETNTQLFRCVSIVVQAFEQACLQPRKFELKLASTVDLSMLIRTV
jgi:hypothetical protein